jgi:hypothetical protein
MFKPDRNAPANGGYLKQAGIFAAVIRFPEEIECMQSGETKIRLRFETEHGTATDDFINMEKLWWKLNVLLAAADPTGTLIPISDGADVDFSHEKNFIAFVKHFDGKAVRFAHFEESYTKKDGTTATSWRVRPLDPRKHHAEQLTKKALAQVTDPAPAQPEEPDEIPF